MAQDYAFQINVNSAARLWVNDTLIIDATCTDSAKAQGYAWQIVYIECVLLSDTLRHHVNNNMLSMSHFERRDILINCALAVWLFMIVSQLACVMWHKLYERIVFYHHAGTQTAYGSNPSSTANNATAWTGNITLPIGYYNITLEYHSGASGGTLILNAGYVGQGIQVSQCHCGLDVLQQCICITTVYCNMNVAAQQHFCVSASVQWTVCDNLTTLELLRRS